MNQYWYNLFVNIWTFPTIFFTSVPASFDYLSYNNYYYRLKCTLHALGLVEETWGFDPNCGRSAPILSTISNIVTICCIRYPILVSQLLNYNDYCDSEGFWLLPLLIDSFGWHHNIKTTIEREKSKKDKRKTLILCHNWHTESNEISMRGC